MRAKAAEKRLDSDDTVTRLSRPDSVNPSSDVASERRNSAPAGRKRRIQASEGNLTFDGWHLSCNRLHSFYSLEQPVGRSSSLPINSPLQDPIHGIALKRLFFDLVIPPKGAGDSRYGLKKGNRGLFESLPTLLARSGQASAYLESSAKAFAFANFAGRQRSNESGYLSA